jgi:DNA-binding NtrC family response regulator
VMSRYSWPGNVRELRNAVERAVVLGDRDQIQPGDLPPQVLGGPLPSMRARNSPPTPPLGSSISQPNIPLPIIEHTPTPLAVAATAMPYTGTTGPRAPVARSLRDLEKEGILAALAATNGNKAQAASILEIDRSTLYKKLKDYDIES